MIGNERILFEAEYYPIFQNRMYETAEAARACLRGDIRLIEDPVTGLVRNAAFNSDRMVYDADYQNEQGVSERFRAHLDRVADLVIARMGKGPLVEVGCGKGTFVDLLRRRGVDVTGFDPAYEGDDPQIRKAYFEPGSDLSGTGLILRHVLEHIADPVGFLRQLASANGNRGRIYIEVPCFDWICSNRAWFDIFYEHANYFRMNDFRRIFDKVIEVGHCFGGQYLQVVADLSDIRDPVYDAGDAVSFPDDFRTDLSAEESEPEDIVWGGASKGMIYAMGRVRAGRPVAGVLDINPAKQKRFLAVTGLQVGDPNETLATLSAGTRILIMNPNYRQEIIDMAGPSFRYVDVGG